LTDAVLCSIFFDIQLVTTNRSIPPTRNMRSKNNHAFTLIELLMVIAVIGILAAILLPVIGTVKDKGNIVASKSQLSGYVNAIGLFKGEYNYYPFGPEAYAEGGASIPGIGEARFVGELSATNLDGTPLTSAGSLGNRKLIDFYNFSESDFLGGNASSGKIADRFNNTNIFIAIDGDGDGLIQGLPDPEKSDGSKVDIRSHVTAYVKLDGNSPDYYLYE